MMVSRGRPRLAWETHYVGDLRAINAQFLDAYQLKSMDTVIDDDMTKFEPFYKRPDGKIALANGQRNKEMFALKERVEEAFDFWDVVIRCTGWLMDLGQKTIALTIGSVLWRVVSIFIHISFTGR